MKEVLIPKTSLSFLKELNKNNNRVWFNDHKDKYLLARAPIVNFAELLIQKMNKTDHIETPSGKKALYRIYRDVRFSKNKTPYNTHWSGYLRRATKALRGGYYFRIEPGGSLLGGGFWGPNSADLKRIRDEIDADDTELRQIITSKKFKHYFTGLTGEKVKTAPRGYSKDHPSIDLLRHKQFLLIRNFSDQEVLEPDFIEHVVDTYKQMRPFFNYMSEILTTNLNGERII